MSNSAEQTSFKLPPQDLDVLSFSAPQPKKVREWVASLPQMNVGESAKRLYSAIQELNRLKADAETRFQLMEIMRPAIHYICASLEKHFLNKSVALPAKEAKIASLTQALQNHLSVGYKAVTLQTLARVKVGDKEAKKLCLLAIHRALSEQGHVLVRCYKLYYPAPPNFWREMHLLYLLAHRFGMLEPQVCDTEDEGWTSSIYDMYLRALLLSTAKPNQLRQQQIQQVFDAARQWAKFASITDAQSVAGLFVIDTTSDYQPIYQALMRRSTLPHNIRYFDASTISDHLRLLLQTPQGQSHPVATFHVPEKLSADLARILIQAWGVLAERAFTRIDEQGELNLCIGLSATHYFVSGRMDFNRMIAGGHQVLDKDVHNPFLSPGARRHDEYENHDVWGLNVDLERLKVTTRTRVDDSIDMYSEQREAEEQDKYPQYRCLIVNSSPGGFCLCWQQDVPPQVKTGEIVGILEKDRGHWSIGVIRWVKQFRDKGVRMGVELIAPKAEACATQAIQKKGGVTEYMRTLMLPELRAIGQPATLITPNIAFHVGYKINLNEAGLVSKGQLIKQVTSTASFAQFQFKLLVAAPGRGEVSVSKRADGGTNSIGPDDDFDSIWSSL